MITRDQQFSFGAGGALPPEILIIGDPWDRLDHARDSSIHLASVVTRRHAGRVFWTTPDRIFVRGVDAFAGVDGEVIHGELLRLDSVRPLNSFQSIHWRKDPPVTQQTLQLWQLLAPLARSGRLGMFVNAPEALLAWNEKFSALRYPEWVIPSAICQNEEGWREFFDAVMSSNPQASIIAKPAAEAASRGVTLLPSRWEHALPRLRELQRQHGPWLVLQEYDLTIQVSGETRIFVVAGEVAAALCKRLVADELIMNLDAAEATRPELSVCEPTSEQLERALRITADLTAAGVRLATIDFIGSRILEINVTSPGLLGWIDQRLPPERNLAMRYWRSVLQQA